VNKNHSLAVLSAVAWLMVVAAPRAATAQAEAAIRQLPIEKWCAAEAAQDLDAKMSLFTSDVVFLVPGSEPIVGKDEVRAFHKADWQEAQWTCTGSVDEVQVLGEWGFVRGAFSGDLTASDGTKTHMSGKFINVVRQEDGRWKIARVIWNRD
jgi:uncharacterized protein (TIGR02246 family)